MALLLGKSKSHLNKGNEIQQHCPAGKLNASRESDLDLKKTHRDTQIPLPLYHLKLIDPEYFFVKQEMEFELGVPQMGCSTKGEFVSANSVLNEGGSALNCTLSLSSFGTCCGIRTVMRRIRRIFVLCALMVRVGEIFSVGIVMVASAKGD